MPEHHGDFDNRDLMLARAGDNSAFAMLVEGLRVSLFRHCYRMLGSGPEAEDAVQDTLLRAWQHLDDFEARGSFEGWIYRIATNLCIDRLRIRPPRTHPVSYGPASAPGSLLHDPVSVIESIEPVADEKVGLGENPEHHAVQRERISLAFIAALQRLAPRQRAALLLHDVLDFSHDEVAEMLDASPVAVNSLLYRARQTIAAAPTIEPADPDHPEVKALLARYIRAWELADISQFLATVSDDVRFSMPPMTVWYQGATDVAAFIETAIFVPSRPHGVTMLLGRVNGQPALATYELGSNGTLVSNGLQVLDISSGSKLITGITSFRDPVIAARCGFPQSVSAPSR